MPGSKKWTLRRSAPSLSSYHRSKSMSTFEAAKAAFSAFYTIFAEVICVFSRLAKTGKKWYPSDTKKGDTKYGNAPAGWAFQSSVLHKCQSHLYAEEHECCGRDSHQTKARSIRTKARLPNDRTQDRTEMTPDPSGRGSFLCPGPEHRKWAGRADPTQLSYHTPRRVSMGKGGSGRKICFLHKSICLYLGNIPS